MDDEVGSCMWPTLLSTEGESVDNFSERLGIDPETMNHILEKCCEQGWIIPTLALKCPACGEMAALFFDPDDMTTEVTCRSCGTQHEAVDLEAQIMYLPDHQKIKKDSPE